MQDNITAKHISPAGEETKGTRRCKEKENRPPWRRKIDEEDMTAGILKGEKKKNVNEHIPHKR